MGVATVAVHSTADADAMHVRMADEASASARRPVLRSYLSMAAVMSPARSPAPRRSTPATGSCRRTPISCRSVEDHGIKFIGPSAEHIRMMGDKITAKETMKNLGVPCVPGSDGRRRRHLKPPRPSPPTSAIR
jgi:acetyl-CoA carboxylase biotin carboxylase subunit